MKAKRIFMSLFGVIITAISIGAFKFAAFGVDPFQSFMSGMEALIPIDFGTLYVIVNAVLLLFSLVFDRHYIGIATFINLFLLGYIVDLSLEILERLFPAPDMMIRCSSFLLGFVFLCFGSSFYMTADMGVSTYDAVALVCANKWNLGRFQAVRISTDFLCIVLGIGMFLLSGGAVSSIRTFLGIGTVVAAFCMGPLIDIFNRYIAAPLLSSDSLSDKRSGGVLR